MKISVIIPAYNAERGLERSVRSVLAQTMREIEVWVVDDGSTDGTWTLANRLAAEDSRVRVIRQDNAGAYAARCAALGRITTPYFAFVDADDVIEPTMYERMLSFAEEHDLDVVQCDLAGAPTNGCSPEVLTDPEEIHNKVIRPFLIDGVTSSFVWDKLYRIRERAPRLLPSQIMLGDDLVMNYQLFRDVHRFGFLHEGLYHYQINTGSSVRNYRRKNVDDLREVSAFRRQLSPQYGVASDDPVHDRWFLRNARNHLISACSAPAVGWRERVAIVRSLLMLPELDQALARTRETASRDRSFICFFRIFPVSCSTFLLRTAARLRATLMGLRK